MKDFKIKHYDYGRTQQRKQGRRAVVVTLLMTAAALAVGWFAYPPVYEMVTGYEALLSQRQDPGPSQPATPQPEPSSVSSSQEEPGGEEMAVFPQSAAYLPPEVVEDKALREAALASMKQKGMDGVIFDLKDQQGMVRYQSGLELVESNRAQAERAYPLPEVIEEIRQAGLVPVGRVYAFKDRTATAHMYESAVKYMDSPVNWIDDSKANGGKPWLNPNDKEAQDYIIALVEEAAGNGLGAILLDGVQFPEGVSLNLATYGNTGTLDKSAILADFLARARGAGEGAGGQVATTVNLISAAGLSNVRYGDDVGKVLEAAGLAVVEVMPEQFGSGVTTETLTLSSPALAPYDTVSQALAACREVLFPGSGDEDQDQEDTPVETPVLAAVVQAYTSQSLSESANKVYGPQEIQDQVRAVQEVGIQRVFYLDPTGGYEAIG